MPTIVTFGVLVAIGIVLSVLPINTSFRHPPYAQETHAVEQLVTACRAFAIENDERLPSALYQLYPHYIAEESLLMFKDRKTGEIAPYIYLSNQYLTNFSGTELIISPTIESEKHRFRIVGHLGGHAATIREDEFRERIKGAKLGNLDVYTNLTRIHMADRIDDHYTGGDIGKYLSQSPFVWSDRALLLARDTFDPFIAFFESVRAQANDPNLRNHSPIINDEMRTIFYEAFPDQNPFEEDFDFKISVAEFYKIVDAHKGLNSTSPYGRVTDKDKLKQP